MSVHELAGPPGPRNIVLARIAASFALTVPEYVSWFELHERLRDLAGVKSHVDNFIVEYVIDKTADELVVFELAHGLTGLQPPVMI